MGISDSQKDEILIGWREYFQGGIIIWLEDIGLACVPPKANWLLYSTIILNKIMTNIHVLQRVKLSDPFETEIVFVCWLLSGLTSFTLILSICIEQFAWLDMNPVFDTRDVTLLVLGHITKPLIENIIVGIVGLYTKQTSDTPLYA